MKKLLLILVSGFMLSVISGCSDHHSHDDGSHSHDEQPTQHDSLDTPTNK